MSCSCRWAPLWWVLLTGGSRVAVAQSSVVALDPEMDSALLETSAFDPAFDNAAGTTPFESQAFAPATTPDTVPCEALQLDRVIAPAAPAAVTTWQHRAALRLTPQASIISLAATVSSLAATVQRHPWRLGWHSQLWRPRRTTAARPLPPTRLFSRLDGLYETAQWQVLLGPWQQSWGGGLVLHSGASPTARQHSAPSAAPRALQLPAAAWHTPAAPWGVGLQSQYRRADGTPTPWVGSIFLGMAAATPARLSSSRPSATLSHWPSLDWPPQTWLAAGQVGYQWTATDSLWLAAYSGLTPQHLPPVLGWTLQHGGPTAHFQLHHALNARGAQALQTRSSLRLTQLPGQRWLTSLQLQQNGFAHRYAVPHPASGTLYTAWQWALPAAPHTAGALSLHAAWRHHATGATPTSSPARQRRQLRVQQTLQHRLGGADGPWQLSTLLGLQQQHSIATAATQQARLGASLRWQPRPSPTPSLAQLSILSELPLAWPGWHLAGPLLQQQLQAVLHAPLYKSLGAAAQLRLGAIWRGTLQRLNAPWRLPWQWRSCVAQSAALWQLTHLGLSCGLQTSLTWHRQHPPALSATLWLTWSNT